MLDKKEYDKNYYYGNKEKIRKKRNETYNKNKEKFKNHKVCTKCKLEYPHSEMRNEICYLCKGGNK